MMGYVIKNLSNNKSVYLSTTKAIKILPENIITSLKSVIKTEIVCNFPQWTCNCAHPELQTQNENGKLTCSLELCEYSFTPEDYAKL